MNDKPEGYVVDVRRNVREALKRMGLHNAQREEAVMVLLDETMPNQSRALAEAGFTYADGAGNQPILREIEARLGLEGQIDRENRDYIQLPLREVGILGIATGDTANLRIIPDYWKAKSNLCFYRVRDDFRRLVHLPDDDFADALDAWIADEEERVSRMASAEAAAAAEAQGGRLVPLSIEHYCVPYLSEYEVVFVDDEDVRDTNEWSHNIERYDLPLNLATRWPDIVLRHPETGNFWIVDAVESDGEVDAVRKREIIEAFESRGHMIDGFTTTYRTVSRFSQRQRAHDNIASGTYVWIAEIGGAHWLKEVRRPHPNSGRS